MLSVCQEEYGPLSTGLSHGFLLRFFTGEKKEPQMTPMVFFIWHIFFLFKQYGKHY